MASRGKNPVKVIRADGTVEISSSRIPAALVRAVFARDGLCCRYCAYRHSDPAKFHVDHVVPVSRGGTNVLKNLVVACRQCNFLKRTETWTPMKPWVVVELSRPLSPFTVLVSQGYSEDEANKRLRKRHAYKGKTAAARRHRQRLRSEG